MSLDTNEEKVELDYIDGFTEKNESINLSNKTILDISRFDGVVIGYVKNFKVEDGIDEIIEVFENDLKTANGVSIDAQVPIDSNFSQSNTLSSIGRIIKNNCDIQFNLSFNDNEIISTRFMIEIYADDRRNIRKNKYLKQMNEEMNKGV